MKFKSQLLSILFALPVTLHATDLNTFASGSLIGKAIQVFVDKTGTQNIEGIQNLDKSSFEVSKLDTLNFGHTPYTYWLKFDFSNSSNHSITRLLEIEYNNIDEVEFFEPEYAESKISIQRFESYTAGMQYPFQIRNINHRNFLYLIEIGPNENKTYYIKTKTMGGLILPIYLWEEKEYNSFDSLRLQGLGFYFGIMFVMIIYNFFIFISVREISYLYYIGYIFGLSGIQLVLTGIGFQNFWPKHTWFQQNAYVIFSTVCMSMSLLFAKSFLNIKIISKRLNFLINFLVYLNILILISIFLFPRSITIIAGIFISVPSVITAIFCGVFSYLSHYRPARYYLLAFSMLILSGLVMIMKFLNLIDSNFFSDYGLFLGSCIEVILLSFALASRINTIKKEKEEAQAKSLEMQKILTESYARFVPHDFLSNLGKDSILDVRLGDQIQKDMAVLFSDIRSFTTLSEKMTPAENFNFINSYLSRMSPIIQRNKGFIDKFIGDAIMALFDKSVIDAVRAGIEMHIYLIEYNSYRKNREYDPIDIGVGIHTGSLMLGTIGAEERLEGTVISDTVNLASRIENLTKVYGSKIAVSEATIDAVKSAGAFSYRFLDRVKVKGKETPVSIYEILDADEPNLKSAKLDTIIDYDKAVTLFHMHELKESKEFFNQVILKNPNDKASQLYLKRIFGLQNPVTISSEDTFMAGE